MTLAKQVAVLRIRIRDYKERIAELSARRNPTNAEARLLLSLQAQVQDDYTIIRCATGEV
jgi:hypothetical protein